MLSTRAQIRRAAREAGLSPGRGSVIKPIAPTAVSLLPAVRREGLPGGQKAGVKQPYWSGSLGRESWGTENVGQSQPQEYAGSRPEVSKWCLLLSPPLSSASRSGPAWGWSCSWQVSESPAKHFRFHLPAFTMQSGDSNRSFISHVHQRGQRCWGLGRVREGLGSPCWAGGREACSPVGIWLLTHHEIWGTLLSLVATQFSQGQNESLE